MRFSSKSLVGVFYGVLGAILFSFKGVIIKTVYQYEVLPVTFLGLRMLFSLPFYLIVIGLHHKNDKFAQLSWGEKLSVFVIGILGYYLSSLFDFLGLQYISATLERLILFVYPTLVMLINFAMGRQLLYPRQIFALVLTYLGIVLALVYDFSFDAKDFWLGASLVFTSAVLYALYLVGSNDYIKRVGSSLFTAYVMSFACFGVFLHYVVSMWGRYDVFDLPIRAYEFGLLIAIVGTVLPSFLVSKSISILGSSSAAITATISPISTIFLANMLLGEPILAVQLLGTGLVLLGVLLITLQKK